jgi:hypothetical protein
MNNSLKRTFFALAVLTAILMTSVACNRGSGCPYKFEAKNTAPAAQK